MKRDSELQSIWLGLKDVYLPLAEVNEKYSEISRIYARQAFYRMIQLSEAYSNLTDIETCIFEYFQIKPRLLGRKLDRQFVIMARAALKNGKILLDLAKSELHFFQNGEVNAPNP